VKAAHHDLVQSGSQKATHQGFIQPGSQSVLAAAASQEVIPAAPNNNRIRPARSSLAQTQSKPGVKSFKLKAPAIKSPDVVASSHAQQPSTASSSKALAAEALLSKPGSTFPHKLETSTTANFYAVHNQQPANASRSSAPAVQADANASTQQQQSVTRKGGRVAAPGSTQRQQPGGGNKGRAPAAKRDAALPSPSQQQTSNRSSASRVSKAAAQHTSAAPPARHRQSKAGVQSSHAHTRSKAHSVERPAAQKQPPTAAWKTQSQAAAQHSASRTALLSFGATALSAQPPQPAQGPSGPMSYAKAAGKGVPKEQDRLQVMDRVPMDNLVFPYLPRQSDSAEEKQAKKLVFDNLTEVLPSSVRLSNTSFLACLSSTESLCLGK